MKIIHFNYLNQDPSWALLHSSHREKKTSFGLILYLCSQSFKIALLHLLRMVLPQLYGSINWLEGNAPKNLWLPLFNDCITPWISIKHFVQGFPSLIIFLLTASTFDILPLVSSIVDCSINQGDAKIWTLESNRSFSVSSLYQFLSNGGFRYPLSYKFWKTGCPSKINLFCWLTWDNKILTLENLAKRGCNQCSTDTCVLCHYATEIIDHLFAKCNFA